MENLRRKKLMANFKQSSNDIKELKIFYPYQQILSAYFSYNPLKITRINERNLLISSKNSMQREILRKRVSKEFHLDYCSL